MGHHYSDAMLTRCADDNYAEGRKYHLALQKIIKHSNAEGAFEPGSFGGSLEMTLPQGKKLWKWRLVDVAPQLGITRNIIIDHLGCGAYDIVFKNLRVDKEMEKHVKTMLKAKAFSQEIAPSIKPIFYLHTDEDAEKNIFILQDGKLLKLEI